GSGVSFGCRGNAAFGFMAFTLQGMSIVVLFLFCALMIQFAVLLWYLADPDTSPHLLPDLDDARDRRRGFQQFEAPLESMLLVVFVAFVLFYLSRLQQVYLRSREQWIGPFVGTIWRALVDKPKDPGVLLTPGSSFGFSDVAVILGGFAMVA